MNTIFVNAEFEGIHYYPDAKYPTEYLQYLHRHIFKVYLEVIVKDLNREIEFIELKHKLNSFLDTMKGPHNLSCEQMCCLILNWSTLNKLNILTVSVSEDGENGACYRK